MKLGILAAAGAALGLGVVAAHAGDYAAKMEAKFSKLDANGDGTVTESEYLAKARADFSEMAGDDGMLTLAETKAHYEKMAKSKKSKTDA